MVDPKKALALFKAGYEYSAIAEQLTTVGDACSEADVRTAVAEAIASSRVALDQSAARIVQLEQIDSMHKAVWPRALKGELEAIDRVVKLQQERERLLGEPTRVKDAITEAFETSLAALSGVTDADAAVVAACRQVARRIDHAVANGTSLEATKALYLLPHLWNGLRELGATPAARAALRGAVPMPEPDGNDDAKGAPVDLDAFKRRSRDGGGAS